MRNKISLAKLKPDMRTRSGLIKLSGAAFFIVSVAFFIASCSKDVIKDQSTNAPPMPLGIVSVIPADQADTVEINPVISVTFKNGTAASVVQSADITLKNGSTLVPGMVTYSGMTATFTPGSDLIPETMYTVLVGKVTKSGSIEGDDHEDNYSWSFRTGHNRRNHGQGPSVVYSFPAR